MKAAAAVKSAGNMESQLTEAHQQLEEETRQKLGLSSKLRQLESEKESLQEQLEEDEEAKKNYERKLAEINIQLSDIKKKAEEDADLVKELEESRKKCNKDIEALQRQIQELQTANDRLDKSKKKIQSELEDATIDLENQKTKVYFKIFLFITNYLLNSLHFLNVLRTITFIQHLVIFSLYRILNIASRRFRHHCAFSKSLTGIIINHLHYMFHFHSFPSGICPHHHHNINSCYSKYR